MSDLVSRQAVIKNAHFPMIDDAGYEVVRVNDILALPSVEPKTGEWDICKDDDGVYGVCSICGCYVDFSLYGRPYKVCPHCGARMEGADDE